MTITYDDAREFLNSYKYEIMPYMADKRTRYEVRYYRNAPFGLFRRTYSSPESAIRNLGLADEYECWQLARWQQDAQAVNR